MERPSSPDLATMLREDTLTPLTRAFPGREEVVELIALALVSGENLLVLGPPGTAKSEIVASFARCLGGRFFEYLLTRFTEPSEIFGPVDVAELQRGRYVPRTEGMLPEADLIFLDEVFHAGSAILNSLLGILNEGMLRRGHQTLRVPGLTVIAASNDVPADPALAALRDRFTLRVEVDYLENAALGELLSAGWDLERARSHRTHAEEVGASGARTSDSREARRVGVEELRLLAASIVEVDVEPISSALVGLIRSARETGIALSDRRAVKIQRLAAASARLSGRMRTDASDLWVARHAWDAPEDREPLEDLVLELIESALDESSAPHPLAARGPLPAELHARLDRLERGIGELETSALAVDRRDSIHNELREIDGQRRWCRSRRPGDVDELGRLGDRVRELSTRLTRVSRARNASPARSSASESPDSR